MVEKKRGKATTCRLLAVAGATPFDSPFTLWAYSFRKEERLFNCVDHVPKNRVFEIFTGVFPTSYAPVTFIPWQACEISTDIGNGG